LSYRKGIITSLPSRTEHRISEKRTQFVFLT